MIRTFSLLLFCASLSASLHQLERRGSEFGPAEEGSTSTTELFDVSSSRKPTETPVPEPVPAIKNVTIPKNETGLLEVYEQLKGLREWMKEPYVHGLVMPAIIGVAAALATVCSVCCINSCIKSAARKRRKRRIRNLSDELKTDRAMLLAEESDDDFA